jgi:predicted nucleic acid-binding protein
MKAAYLDSSALVKRYVDEPGSGTVNRLFAGGAPLLVSAIAWSECLAALARKRHDGSLPARAHQRVCRALAGEWESLHEIGVTAEIRSIIRELLERTPLRGMDAIHLASAIWAGRRLDSPVAFWCSDHRLAAAALDCDVDLVNPESN